MKKDLYNYDKKFRTCLHCNLVMSQEEVIGQRIRCPLCKEFIGVICDSCRYTDSIYLRKHISEEHISVDLV